MIDLTLEQILRETKIITFLRENIYKSNMNFAYCYFMFSLFKLYLKWPCFVVIWKLLFNIKSCILNFISVDLSQKSPRYSGFRLAEAQITIYVPALHTWCGSNDHQPKMLYWVSHNFLKCQYIHKGTKETLLILIKTRSTYLPVDMIITKILI